MGEIIIENIVASIKIAEKFDLEQLSKSIVESKYDPDEFGGLTIKFNDPKIAVLILSDGKLVCTGAKSLDEVKDSFNKVSKKIEIAGVTIKKKVQIDIQNFVVSTNLQKELHLASIAKGLLLQNVEYNPDQFPGLIYRTENSSIILLVFNSGKIVSTGAKNLEEATKAIEMIKEKLSSLGAL